MPASKEQNDTSRTGASGITKQIIETAHGPGHKLGFSYSTDGGRRRLALLGSQDLATIASVLVKLFAQTTNPVGIEGFPIETSVESIAWYLLSINPFLDYAFTLPGKQSVLMLDWAKEEDVLFPKIRDGQNEGYNPLMPGDAAGTPRPRNNLTECRASRRRFPLRTESREGRWHSCAGHRSAR